MRPSTLALLVLLQFSINLCAQGKPKIENISPTSGSTGTVVTITGSGFDKSKDTVTFSDKNAKGNKAKIQKWADTSIEAVVPEISGGEFDVTVKVGENASNSEKFTDLGSIELFPESAAPGDPVTITVKGFDATKATSVMFAGKTAKFSASGSDSIGTVVPMGASQGNVAVTVGGGSVLKPFTVKPAEYDQSAFEVLTGVGAVLAGAEATSYKPANDAMAATNVGRKTPEILLGGGFILPWHRGGGWIEKSYCGASEDRHAAKVNGQTVPDNCLPGGAYDRYRPWETFLSIRFAPGSDQTINGFVLGGGYRITKYFSLMVGYSVTPVDEPSPGFRVAAAQVVAANPTISPYNRYNASDLLQNKPGAFDGFPLFLYTASGVTTTKIFPNNPTVTHHRSGIYFGVGIPLNLTALFKPSAK